MYLSSCSLLDSVLDKSCAFLTVSAPPEKEEKEKGAEQAKEFAAAIPAILSAVNSVLTSALSMDNRIPCMHRIFQVRSGPHSHTIPLLNYSLFFLSFKGVTPIHPVPGTSPKRAIGRISTGAVEEICGTQEL